MKSFTYTVTDEAGLHARPAGILVKKAKEYASTVTIDFNGKKADAGRMMAIMGLCVKQGNTVTVEVEGADEDTAVADLEQFFKENL